MVRILPATCPPPALVEARRATTKLEDRETLFLNLCTAVFTGKFSAAMI